MMEGKSMVGPRVAEWRAKFKDFRGGKEIVALTGESSADLRLLEMADLPAFRLHSPFVPTTMPASTLRRLRPTHCSSYDG